MNKGKVYELNGVEQKILKEQCIVLRAMTKGKIKKQDAIKSMTAEIKRLSEGVKHHDGQSKRIISYMADKFGLTRVQVINKILVENKKN